MRSRWLAAVAVLAAFGVAGSAQAAAPKVKVTLKEFKVIPKPKSVKPGKATFTAKNTGNVGHELVVMKTNVAPGQAQGEGEQGGREGPRRQG